MPRRDTDDVDVTAEDRGSLERRRTAWTTGIGHDRVTPEELDKRYELAQEAYMPEITYRCLGILY